MFLSHSMWHILWHCYKNHMNVFQERGRNLKKNLDHKVTKLLSQQSISFSLWLCQGKTSVKRGWITLGAREEYLRKTWGPSTSWQNLEVKDIESSLFGGKNMKSKRTLNWIITADVGGRGHLRFRISETYSKFWKSKYFLRHLIVKSAKFFLIWILKNIDISYFVYMDYSLSISIMLFHVKVSQGRMKFVKMPHNFREQENSTLKAHNFFPNNFSFKRSRN